MLAGCFAYGDGKTSARLGDLRQIASVGGAFRRGFGLSYRDIAKILDMVAEGGEALVQVGYTHGRGTHVYTAAILAEVEGRADDGDVGLAHGVLKLCRTGSAREGDHVADIFHTRQVHHHTLQAQAKAGVRGCAVFAEIEIPLIGLFGETLQPDFFG